MLHSSKVEQVEKVLAQHIARLRVSLQHASGALTGPEEGSDAWLLLNALIWPNVIAALAWAPWVIEQVERAMLGDG